jgi:hypothetical protein
VGRRIEWKIITVDPIGDIVSKFGVLEVREPEALHQDSRNREVQNPEKEKSVMIEDSLLLIVSGFDISAVVKTRVRDSLFWNS